MGKIAGWSRDYTELDLGDEFALEGIEGSFRVMSIRIVSSRDTSQSPSMWHFGTDKGDFTYDPWASHIYRRFLILNTEVRCKEDAVRLDAVYTEEFTASRRKPLPWEGDRRQEECVKACEGIPTEMLDGTRLVELLRSVEGPLYSMQKHLSGDSEEYWYQHCREAYDRLISFLRECPRKNEAKDCPAKQACPSCGVEWPSDCEQGEAIRGRGKCIPCLLGISRSQYCPEEAEKGLQHDEE